MAASSSFERAQRLPGNFAWIAVAVDAALFALGMAAQLLPFSPHGEQMRGVYAQPGVWVPLLSRAVSVWLLAATLAWCHARQALDERGAVRTAQLRGAGSRFGAVFLAARLVNMLALTPLFYQAQLLFMPGGPLHERVGTYGLRPVMGVSMLVQSAIQMLVLVASVWLAARFALRERGTAPVDASPGAADDGAGIAPPRRAVALVAAATLVSLQLWIGHAASGWVDTSRDSDLVPLLLGWFAVPLLVFALAFWGGWLGAAPGPAQARPFRAVAAAVSAFVLLQLACAALALGGLLWVASASFSGTSSDGRLVALAVLLSAVYLVLLVLAMRALTRRFYRRYL
ncbi:hypothetical protein J2738_001984 [Variovorax paradoxus]|uniref:Uncharacterized protein n=1 Tax=Variovorax paradoxus TaxID=34073 RepID=A0AAE4BXW1_VARPD|nr:hypothetical protein [Variovorax paradoxus]MDR6425855.1 hypothetical protein [Variovorax paradoxus]